MGWDVCRKVFCGVLHSGRGKSSYCVIMLGTIYKIVIL